MDCNKEKFVIIYRELLEKYGNGSSMMSKTQLADYIGVSEKTIRRLIHSGKAPKYIKIGEGATAPYMFHMLNIAEWVLNEEYK